MRKLRLLGLLALVAALAGPSALAQGTVEELLNAVPEGTPVVVVIRSFTEFQQDLATTANHIVPGQGMMLPIQLQQMLGLPQGGRGLNLMNSVGVIFLELEDEGGDAAVLLPMSSYDEFSNALVSAGFVKSQEDNLDSFSLQGFAGEVTYYAAGGGAYRLWTQSKPLAKLYQEKVQAQVPMLASTLPAKTKELIAASDVSAYLAVEQLVPELEDGLQDFMSALEQAPFGGASPELQQQQEAGREVVKVEAEAGVAILKQIKNTLVTVDMDDTGLTLRARGTAKPDTAVAAFFADQQSGGTVLLAQLPADSWMAFSGKVDPEMVRTGLKDFVTELLGAVSNDEAELQEKITLLLESVDIQTGESAVAFMTVGQAGSFLNFVQLSMTTDPAKARRLFKEGVLVWQGSSFATMAAGSGIDFNEAEVKEHLETYRGVDIGQVAIPVNIPPGMPPGADEMFRFMYGNELLYQYATVENTLVVTFGGMANELMKKTVDGMKDGATGIAQTPGYKSAVAGLPKDRSLTGYFSLVRFAQTLYSFFMQAAQTGQAPPPFDLESVQGITPSGVGTALSFTDEDAVLSVYLPKEELVNVGLLIQEISKSMMPPQGAPGMGPPGPPPPAP